MVLILPPIFSFGILQVLETYVLLVQPRSSNQALDSKLWKYSIDISDEGYILLHQMQIHHSPWIFVLPSREQNIGKID